MKTLDEVIKAIDVCLVQNTCKEECPYWGQPCANQLGNDVIHYLKLLKVHCDRVQNQIDDLREEYRPNEPLSWNELKGMEGKPVWIEFKKNGNHWLIITDIKSNGAVGRGVYGENAPLYKDRIGTDWQAYRKERG